MRYGLVLCGQHPLVSGAYRDVYQYPDDDDFLIKTIRPLARERHRQRLTWYNAWRRAGYYKTLLRELNEYLAIERRGQAPFPFVQHWLGLVATDLGFGMVVRKVRGRDGGLAPTLAAEVARSGFTAELRARFDELIEDVARRHILWSDLSPTNVLVANDPIHGDRLVIIDGLGDRRWIPVNAMSFTANRFSLIRHARRLVRTLEQIEQARRPAPALLVVAPD